MLDHLDIGLPLVGSNLTCSSSSRVSCWLFRGISPLTGIFRAVNESVRECVCVWGGYHIEVLMGEKLSGLINFILQMVAVGSYLTKVIVEIRGLGVREPSTQRW